MIIASFSAYQMLKVMYGLIIINLFTSKSFFCPIKLKLDRTETNNAEMSTFAENSSKNQLSKE